MTDNIYNWEKDREKTAGGSTPDGGPDMSVQLGRIRLKNPILTSSGTFSHGECHLPFYDISVLGAVTTKSYSMLPQKGNPPPRTCETAGGMLNSIGLQNDGINEFLNSHLRVLKDAGAQVILSIFGRDAEEFKKVALKVLDVKSDILAVELNLSCPNVEADGVSFCAIPGEVEKVVDAVVSMLDIPVIAKLSPNHENIAQAARAARDSGAQAISVINTVIGMAVDAETRKPMLGNITGGLSGPAVKPIALARIYRLAKEDILPIIGMGGVFDHLDVIEFMLAGAAAVSLGTVNLVDYDAGKRIVAGLREYMIEKGIKRITSLTGGIRD